MTEQLVNLTEENNFYNKYIANGKTTQRGLSLSNATSYLANPNTIANYYKTNLRNIRKAYASKDKRLIDRALKSVKEVNGQWRLKLQLSKYPHPLFIDDGDAEHECFLFDTQEEALQGFEDWIEQLESRERGILRAVKSAYQNYCKSENVDAEYDEKAEAFFDIKQEVA